MMESFYRSSFQIALVLNFWFMGHVQEIPHDRVSTLKENSAFSALAFFSLTMGSNISQNTCCFFLLICCYYCFGFF